MSGITASTSANTIIARRCVIQCPESEVRLVSQRLP
jgi:hypothetical protein